MGMDYRLVYQVTKTYDLTRIVLDVKDGAELYEVVHQIETDRYNALNHVQPTIKVRVTDITPCRILEAYT